MTKDVKFKFDRTLWRRFLLVFKLYLYPDVKNSGWHLFGLMTAAFGAVLILSIWIFSTIKYVTASVSMPFYDTYIKTVLRGFFIFDFDHSIQTTCWLLIIMLGIAYYFWSQRAVLKPRLGRWGTVVVILFFLLCVTEANIILVNTFRLITNALVDFQAKSNIEFEGIAKFVPHHASQIAFWNNLGIYGVLLVVILPVLIGYFYIRLKYIRYWRGWLTRKFMQHYYHDRAYYRLHSNDPDAMEKGIDNPDQRMSQDLRTYTEATLGFILDFCSALLDLIGFTGLLWFNSPKLSIVLVLYAVIATVLAALISRRLITIEFNQLKYEANFRFGLIHTRNNAESIAFYDGEEQEQNHNDSLLERALKNFDKKIVWLSIIGFYQRSYSFVSRIFPYFFIVPDFFNGNIKTFGDIELILFSFGMVQAALSTITFSIDSIARSAASINRLAMFYEQVSKPDGGETEGPERDIALVPSAGGFDFKQLNYFTPQGEQELLANFNFELGQQRLMIVGPSGCGKSSLLRVIAGLWDTGSGEIQTPPKRELFFVPQRPYMVLGTLREQLLFPYMDAAIADSLLVEQLNRFGLGGVLARVGGLDAILDWSKVLSLGEQQRVSIIRVLVHQPGYVLMDECTSALDGNNEKLVFDTLAASTMQYIAVCHDHRLVSYFDQVLIFEHDQNYTILSAAEYKDRLNNEGDGLIAPA